MFSWIEVNLYDSVLLNAHCSRILDFFRSYWLYIYLQHLSDSASILMLWLCGIKS